VRSALQAAVDQSATRQHAAIADALVKAVNEDDVFHSAQQTLALAEPMLATVTPDEVIAHCRTKVAGYKVPRDVWFVESMERHPSGKPDYRWAKTTATALANP
jgi:acyl-CoA synthetase (AMP-forming)/AMP-acid ligase II